MASRALNALKRMIEEKEHLSGQTAFDMSLISRLRMDSF